MVRKISPVCRICGQPLNDLITYVPKVGECCPDCYRKTSEAKLTPKKKLAKTKNP